MPVILVVEDNIRYYSSFLPVIYTELITQSRRLIREGINVAHKLVRMRARPKILLASNYEACRGTGDEIPASICWAWSRMWNFLAMASSAPKPASNWPDLIREAVPDVPIVLQSSRTAIPRARSCGRNVVLAEALAHAVCVTCAAFSPSSSALATSFFACPICSEVGRASDLNSLETMLARSPSGEHRLPRQRNHFSHWLMARTEFALAQKLRPRKVSDFDRRLSTCVAT